jgi:transcriptional regulator with XRE-family HTH domain
MIGENIKAARLAAGMTQKELAVKVGVPYQSLQRWERGAFKPSMGNLINLAAALGKTVEELAK